MAVPLLCRYKQAYALQDGVEVADSKPPRAPPTEPPLAPPKPEEPPDPEPTTPDDGCADTMTMLARAADACGEDVGLLVRLDLA